MPKIPPVLLNGIIYLFPDEGSARIGAQIGASGFLLGIPSETVKTATHIYAVTNSHVINDPTSSSPVVRLNLKHPSSQFERTEVFPFTKDSWTIHPKHDLAVRPFPRDVDPSIWDYALFRVENLMTQKWFEDNEVGPGDDLFYVGRFMNHAGEFENIPSTRFGNISMVPNEREPIKYHDGERTINAVGFLVEARSRSGYSGSPVFWYDLAQTNKSRYSLVFTIGFTSGFKILGVDWGHIPEEVEFLNRTTGMRMKVEVHSGMMGVVPAWYLEEFMRTAPSLVEQRQRDDAHYGAHPPTGVPDASP